MYMVEVWKSMTRPYRAHIWQLNSTWDDGIIMDAVRETFQGHFEELCKVR